MSVRGCRTARPRPDPFLGWLLGRVGLDCAAYRPAAMQRRLPACLRQLRVNSPAAARELLERRPELAPLALNAVLIGVSDFFRDEAVFAFLGEQVLPELLRERGRLRICSAGCSGGQELYSLAILLAELEGLHLADLLGVDCRPAAIARAAEGVFSNDELDGVSSRRLARFFRSEEGRWAVRPELRRRLRWRVADLLSFEAGAGWDLVFFRNVAIYLEDEPLAHVWARLADALAPGGFLVTGRAERPPAELPFRRVVPCIYQWVP